MSPTGDELLADVLANPDDDGPRLVYADWLSAHQNPRGELITVQCAIAAAGKDPPPRLTKRESQLLVKHGKKWRVLADQFADRVIFKRGFITEIRSTASAFVDRGVGLLETEPVESLELSESSRLPALANAAHLAKLRRISFTYLFYHSDHVDALRAFMHSPNLRVHELAIELRHNAQFTPQLSFDRVFKDLTQSTIRRLYFAAPSYMIPSFVKANFPALELLELSAWQTDPASVQLVSRAFSHAKVRAKR